MRDLVGLVGRYLVMASIVFWLGGFTFYISIVVPAGTERLGSIEQGFITREVTRIINISATLALAMLLVETWGNGDPGRIRRWVRRGLWLGMASCQVVLFLLHPLLSGMMDDATASVQQRPVFYQWHRVYLWTHTAQWALALLDLLLLLSAWRAIDRRPRPSVEPKPNHGPST